MSKFTSLIATTLSAMVLTSAGVITLGSMITTENVANPTMNPLQVACVGQKNVNAFGFHTVKTVVTQNQDDFLSAFVLGWVSLPILASETFICVIALAVLAGQAKNAK
jgi:hypothetical protein